MNVCKWGNFFFFFFFERSAWELLRLLFRSLQIRHMFVPFWRKYEHMMQGLKRKEILSTNFVIKKKKIMHVMWAWRWWRRRKRTIPALWSAHDHTSPQLITPTLSTFYPLNNNSYYSSTTVLFIIFLSSVLVLRCVPFCHVTLSPDWRFRASLIV